MNNLATSIKSTADFSCSAAVALSDEGVVYIRDMIRGKWEWPDCRRLMIQTMLGEPEVGHAVEKRDAWSCSVPGTAARADACKHCVSQHPS